jgi:4-hydroxy-2-oxoheptanedioate aldolase
VSEAREIRPNLAKRKLAAGQPVLAPILGANSIPDRDTLDQLGALGVIDIAWAEMEHGPQTWADLSDISRVCDLWGMTSLVRVNDNSPAQIGRTLDRGIQAVIVPHVNTADEARLAVEGAFYPPLGRRGAAGPRTGYGVSNYRAKANDEVMCIVMIEEQQAIKNLDKILAVEGIDAFFVGPHDLSSTMGLRFDAPDVQKVVCEAVTKIVESGHSAGTLVTDDTVENFLALGVRFLRFSALDYLQKGLRSFSTRVQKAVPA